MSTQVAHPTPKAKWSRRRRIMAWSIATILIGSLVLPLTGYLYVAVSSAFAQQEAPSKPSATEQQTNPRANYWRAVRQGYDGYTAASGPYTTNVLIQNGGQNWRQIRNGPVETLATWLLALVVGAILVFAIVRGQVKLSHRPSGRTVERWNVAERVLHWYTAILFIILAISGLSILFGRAVLIPALGYAGFSAYASAAIALHNYLGPFFVIGVVVEVVAWIKDMFPEKSDAAWLKQGGGFLGKGSHPHAGRINAGEKYITFWIGLVLLGGAVSISGILLDFPIFGQSRETMQLANVVHTLASAVWLSLMLGHIYLGAWGVEGAWDGMAYGRVSVEWAKEHHDLWYDEVGYKTEETGDKPSRGATKPA